VRFATAARLVLYTDGVIETPGPNDDQFGIDRLASLTASHPEQTTAAFADMVVDTIRRFAGLKDNGSRWRTTT